MDHPVFDHEGPWTEGAYLALPRTGRVEVVDGTLLVGPGTTARRARIVDTVCDAVRETLPEGLRVDGPVPVRLGPDCVLVPDLVVVSAGVERDGGGVLDAAAALMVIELVGRDHGATDRTFKPQLYARSRIPYLLQIDHDAPFAMAEMIISGRYHEYARADADQPLRIDEPFVLELDLAAATRTEVDTPATP